MRLFADLYDQLDAVRGTNEKLRALEAYFRAADPADAAWAVWILSGRRIRRALSRAELREALHLATNLPDWLIDECRDAVGDFSETIALLTPPPTSINPPSLDHTMREIITQLPRWTSPQRVAAVLDFWQRTSPRQRFVFHKLLSGSFRVGVSRALLVRALAHVANIPQPAMDHRLMGEWSPTADAFHRFLDPATHDVPATQPYPFFLASPLQEDPRTLGERNHFLAEWKWDGIRAQALLRNNAVTLWSRGEESISDRFPELKADLAALPVGTVLDGEILAWDAPRRRPLPFHDLQTRINRLNAPNPAELLFVDTPVVFMAYDLLELQGSDIRQEPLHRRRAHLESLLASVPHSNSVFASEVLHSTSWDDLAALRDRSREMGVEGIMLKRLDSPYATGRERGAWWKWKIDPFTFDAVLVAAQHGSGKRASVYTDYTFAVWSDPTPGEGKLVTIAKAYSGLTDDEIDQVDAFVRRATLSRHGPVRVVRPELVFELACEAIQPSARHASGLAVRFPRILRQRLDKKAKDADTIHHVRHLTQLPREPPIP